MASPCIPWFPLHTGWLSVWFLTGPGPFSALLLLSHASTYFYLPSCFVFTGSIQSCLQVWPPVVRFAHILSSHFLKFDVLVMLSSWITFTFISMTIYVRPPRVFLMHGTSPTITLLWKFSMISKLQCVMLMRFYQISCCDILSMLFWDGKLCWTVVWRCALHSLISPILTQLPRVWLNPFPTSWLILWNECGIWRTKVIVV